MATAIQIYEQQQAQPKSMAAIGAERTALRNLMRDHMKEGVHYLTIPGTPKPTLTKPGSELILSMLHIAAEPIVEDLSTPDEMRYRVFVQLTEMGTGRFLGKGVGEASSAESKYQWRGVVCPEEFDETPEDRRRVIWKKGYGGSNPFRIQQVRTEKNDVANTILKMSKKRGQIDGCLTVSACSDLFLQDAQEVIDAGIDLVGEEDGTQTTQQQRPTTLQPKQQPQTQQQPQGDQQTQQSTQSQQSSGGPIISEPQARRFYAIAKGAGKENAEIDNYLKSIGVDRKEDIPKSKYEAAVSWAESR